jgi:hypothetical protein
VHHVTRRQDGLRASTREQGCSGLGIDAQRAAAARFAQAWGFEVVGEFTEIETGKGSDAPPKARRGQPRGGLFG